MITLQQTNDKINAQGGLALIGRLISKLCPLGKLFAPAARQRSDKLSAEDILTTQIGLLSMGRSQYEDIESFRESAAPGCQGSTGESFSQCLGTAFVPSESTLRNGIKAIAEGDTESLDKLSQCSLNVIKTQVITPCNIGDWSYVPCDVDVACFNNDGSHRENLGRTYHGYHGFAPIFAYIGAQGYLLDHEMRPGSQHCQKGTPEFLSRALKRIDELALSDEVLVRMDSGNDSADTLSVLRQSKHRFIVKRNQRQENPVKWLSLAMAMGAPDETPRPGKEVWLGTCNHLRPGGENSTQDPLPVAYRVTRRSIDKKGQALLVDEIEVETYWTNLWQESADIIELYHAHGTSEQFHSELKSDLNLERFPSHSYAVNSLMLSLGTLAYNLMRVIEQMARECRKIWPTGIKRVERRRVGSVVKDLILVAGKLVKHSGKVVLKLASAWSWVGVILDVDRRIRALPNPS